MDGRETLQSGHFWNVLLHLQLRLWFQWIFLERFSLITSEERTFAGGLGVIHLVRTQKFPKNCHFTPRNTHTRNVSFSESFAYVLNGWLLIRIRHTHETNINISIAILTLIFFQETTAEMTGFYMISASAMKELN